MQNLSPNGIYILTLTVTKGENTVLTTESERHGSWKEQTSRIYMTSWCLAGRGKVTVNQDSDFFFSIRGFHNLSAPKSISLHPFFSASHAFSIYVLWDRSFNLWRWNASKICVVIWNLREEVIGNGTLTSLSKNQLISYYVTFSFFIHISTDFPWIFITKQCWVLC